MAHGKFLGIGLFDVAVHVLVTLGAAYIASSLSDGALGDTLVTAVFATSLVLLAWRRNRALGREPQAGDEARVDELEFRVAELEAQQQRMLELEERVDFAERVLARKPESPELPR